MTVTSSTPSTRPYLIRALHEWCMDHGFTPYVAVSVDEYVRVPRQFVADGEIVLNISTDATSALVMGNEYIDFKARFGGVLQDISVPVGRVMAIYARENGQGMAFPVEPTPTETPSAVDAPRVGAVTQSPSAVKGLVLVDDVENAQSKDGVTTVDSSTGEISKPPGKGKPSLKLIK
jgi:stringent starvation protein B